MKKERKVRFCEEGAQSMEVVEPEMEGGFSRSRRRGPSWKPRRTWRCWTFGGEHDARGSEGIDEGSFQTNGAPHGGEPSNDGAGSGGQPASEV